MILVVLGGFLFAEIYKVSQKDGWDGWNGWMGWMGWMGFIR